MRWSGSRFEPLPREGDLGVSGEVVIAAHRTSGTTLYAQADLYDPTGTLVGSNSPGNGSTASLTLLSTGTYTIVVHDFGYDDTGAYNVDLQFTTGKCGLAILCNRPMAFSPSLARMT